MFLFATK